MGYQKLREGRILHANPSAGTEASTLNLASSIVIVMRRLTVTVDDDRPPSGSVGRDGGHTTNRS